MALLLVYVDRYIKVREREKYCEIIIHLSKKN